MSFQILQQNNENFMIPTPKNFVLVQIVFIKAYLEKWLRIKSINNQKFRHKFNICTLIRCGLSTQNYGNTMQCFC